MASRPLVPMIYDRTLVTFVFYVRLGYVLAAAWPLLTTQERLDRAIANLENDRPMFS